MSVLVSGVIEPKQRRVLGDVRHFHAGLFEFFSLHTRQRRRPLLCAEAPGVVPEEKKIVTRRVQPEEVFVKDLLSFTLRVLIACHNIGCSWVRALTTMLGNVVKASEFGGQKIHAPKKE